MCGESSQQGREQNKEKKDRKRCSPTFNSCHSLYLRPVTAGGRWRELCAFSKSCGVYSSLVGLSEAIWTPLHVACFAGILLAFGVCFCKVRKCENADAATNVAPAGSLSPLGRARDS